MIVGMQTSLEDNRFQNFGNHAVLVVLVFLLLVGTRSVFTRGVVPPQVPKVPVPAEGGARH